MNSTDSIQIQAQIRRNAIEQNEVLRGLSSWEEDMKKKEEDVHVIRDHQIINDDAGETHGEAEPNDDDNDDPRTRMKMAKDIRSSIIMRTGDDDHVSSSSSSTTKLPKPVEVPLPLLVNTKHNNSSSSSKSSSIKSMEEEERQRGNQFYSTKRYDEALKCYTKCILMNHKSVAAYSNRAMVHLKQKDWINAESDASSALELDPTHVKSYQRRSVARSSLGKVRASLYDLYLARAATAAASIATEATTIVMIDTTKMESALKDIVKKAPKRKVKVAIHEKNQQPTNVSIQQQQQQDVPSSSSLLTARIGGMVTSKKFETTTMSTPPSLEPISQQLLPSSSSKHSNVPPPSSSSSSSAQVQVVVSSSSVKPIHKMRSWCELEQVWNSLSKKKNNGNGTFTSCMEKHSYLQQNKVSAPRAIRNLYKHGMESSDMLLDLVLHCSQMKVHVVDQDQVDDDDDSNTCTRTRTDKGANSRKIRRHDGYKILKALSHIPSIDMLVMMMASTEKSLFAQYVSEICAGLNEEEEMKKIHGRFGLV